MPLGLSGCTINIDRNPDGSLNLEALMDEATLQSELRAAIADPLVQDLTVELSDGYIQASTERKRIMIDDVDSLSFRLDLGVQDGHMTAEISEAQLNGEPLEEERVEAWNARIATRLERAGRRNPDSTLEAVTISDESLTMVYRVETWRSRNP
jgi:hypothetical protein